MVGVIVISIISRSTKNIHAMVNGSGRMSITIDRWYSLKKQILNLTLLNIKRLDTDAGINAAPIQRLQIELMDVLKKPNRVLVNATKDIHKIVDDAGGMSSTRSRYRSSHNGF